MPRLVQVATSLPAPAQHSVNGAAVTTALASFFDLIHGPLSVLVLILSAVWLVLQIYAFLAKRANDKKTKRSN